METPRHRTPEPAWNAWGSGEAPSPPPPHLRELLEHGLGVERRDTPSVPEAETQLGESALPTDARAALEEAVGDHVRTDDPTRLRRSGGKSTTDLLRRRAGDARAAPDAVVLPGTHDEVLAVLQVCAAHRVAIVAFGGGTSVVGGVEPRRDGFEAVVTLDLRRLNALTALDATSGTATLQAGVRGPEAEELLGRHGLSLGHFPQSFEFASLGGYAATRSSGQASSGYGRFDDMVLGLKVATPRGTLELGRGPASAAGPDLRQLLLGSEGTLGVITEVTVRVQPAPTDKHYEAWAFPDFASGSAALRELARADALPTVARLADETETGLTATMGGDADPVTGCLLVTVYEGTAEHVAARHGEASALLSDAGGVSLGAEPAASWERGRFHGPYLRDSLLEANALAETLETAAMWSNVDTTRSRVREAIDGALREQGAPPIVMCHISHIYPTGASLYFTVACAQGEEPAERWRLAKRAATDAIAECGATITHHHAVGLEHRDWMPEEVGDLGVEVLRSVKAALDPQAILNPGKLVPRP